MSATEKFSKANAAFVDESYEDAGQLYTEAIAEDGNKDEYYIARAHTRTKLEDYKGAIDDASKAIELSPNNSKAYLRKGVAHFNLDDFNSALEAFSKGQSLEGSDKSFSTWIRKCQAELDMQKKSETNSASGDQVLTGSSSVSNENQSKETSSEDKPAATTPSTTTTPTAIPTPQAPAVSMPTGPKTRYDWYQTETHVIVTILVKNVKKEDLHTDIEERTLNVSIKLPSGGEYTLDLDLSHPITSTQSTVKLLSSKVEIKLKKQEGLRWNKLDREPTESNVKQFTQAADSSTVTKYPSSSHYTRDWDKIASDMKKEEKDEKLEGDAALNQLFEQIYSDGNDEVRKAMNKSFVESGGTVLSTNWNEIGDKKTDVKPPDGMEHKSYSA